MTVSEALAEGELLLRCREEAKQELLAADLRGCVEAEVESLLISEAEAELELLDADLR